MAKNMSPLPSITFNSQAPSASPQTANSPQAGSDLSDCLTFVEDEKCMLKGEIKDLKQMFQAVHFQPSSPATPTKKSFKPRKSVTPKQLKKHKATFNLDDVDLDNVVGLLVGQMFIFGKDPAGGNKLID